MRFGGLVAVNDLSFTAGKRRHHRAHRAQWRRQDHGLQLHHRLLQADHRPHGTADGGAADADDRRPSRTPAIAGAVTPTGRVFLLERMPDFEIAAQGESRAHVPEHPPVLGHDRAGKPDRRPAQRADGRLGLDDKGLFGAKSYRDAEKAAVEKAKYWLERSASRTAPTIRQAIFPTARSAGSKSHAPCARAPCCSASTSRPPASIRAKAAISTRCCGRSATTHGTSILLIEHDMSVVMEISDHVVVLEYGTKISDGTPDFVQERSEGDRSLSRRRRRRSREAEVAAEVEVMSRAAPSNFRRQKLLRQHHGAEGRRSSSSMKARSSR